MSFDRVVVVDWSANSRPKRGADSIWIATRDVNDAADTCPGVTSVVNVPTRCEAEGVLDAVVQNSVSCRTLLAVDFSLGFPRGTATAFGLRGRDPASGGHGPWDAMWNVLGATIEDGPDNRNNRFAVASRLNARQPGRPGPFWGCPPSAETTDLRRTKPTSRGGLGEWRLVEEVLRAVGRRPASSWQLLGAGSVGGQSLVGIALLDRLRRRHGTMIDVWPFTTRLILPDRPADAPAGTVIAEVWPSMWMTPASADAAALSTGSVRDAVQVEAVADQLVELDRAGRLAPLFSPTLDASLVSDSTGASGSARRPDLTELAVVEEEGWVLGVSAPGHAATHDSARDFQPSSGPVV